jgi:hypothetical protein
LAIAGDVENAVSIAYSTLPQGMAAGISPYLRYMPQLTRAQQAAAANFGHFPRASEIGRDDPRVARYSAAADAAAQVANADTLGGSGRARGKSTRDRNRKNTKVAVAAPPPPVAPPEAPEVSREVSAPGIGSKPVTSGLVQAPEQRPVLTLPQQARAAPRAVTPTPATQPVKAAPAGPPTPDSAPASRVVMGPVLTDPDVPKSRAAATAAPPVPRPPATAPVTNTPAAPSAPPQLAPAATPRSVADAFGDLSGPMPDAAPTAGAVDIRRITPARPKPKEAAKPAKPLPPSHPSRIWVQLAMGRNKDALGFDWRRMVREAPEQFRGKKGNVSATGQNNRLLAGPFPSEAAATSFITQLRRADIEGAFVWTSPAGQVVDALATP